MPSGSSYPQPTAVVQQIYEAITERLLRSYPIKDYPLCIRPVSQSVAYMGRLLRSAC
jgi:hypothetical protein